MAYNVLMIIGVVLQLIGITIYCFGSFKRDDVYRVAGGGVGVLGLGMVLALTFLSAMENLVVLG